MQSDIQLGPSIEVTLEVTGSLFDGNSLEGAVNKIVLRTIAVSIFLLRLTKHADHFDDQNASFHSADMSEEFL